MANAFYTWSNNAVTAVAPAEVYHRMEKYPDFEKLTGIPIYQPAPIFTFVDPDRFPQKARFTTGSLKLMERLLEGKIVIARRFYVPFSNGYELGNAGPTKMDIELSMMTSLDDVLEHFGLLLPAQLPA